MDLHVSRKEKKFFTNRAIVLQLMKRIDAQLDRDANSKSLLGYPVRSLYFDSPFDQDYWEVLQGIEERRKIRMRIYRPDDTIVKLEHKYKLGDCQQKTSISLTRKQAQAIMNGEVDSLLKSTSAGALSIFKAFRMEVYRPRVLIEYNRIAWVGPMNDTRLTWDTNIRVSRTDFSLLSPHVNWTMLTDESVGVFEVKYNGFLNSYIEQMLEPLNGLPEAFSKYALSCAL